MLTPDSVVFLRGEIDKRREEPSLRVTEVIPLADAGRVFCNEVLLSIGGDFANESVLQQLKSIVTAHRGSKPLFLKLPTEGGLTAVLRCDAKFTIDFTPQFADEVSALIGAENVTALAVGNRRIPCVAGAATPEKSAESATNSSPPIPVAV